MPAVGGTRMVPGPSPSGTSVQGASIVRAFPFAFNTPGILTGHAVYTPTVGDQLLDAWVGIDTAWDGTTPTFDFGSFVGQNQGAFSNAFLPVPMNLSDTFQIDNTWLSQATFNADTDLHDATISSYLQPTASKIHRWVPAEFTTTDPIKVVVSQDGTNTGADPGSTQGAAVLYLVTATPA